MAIDEAVTETVSTVIDTEAGPSASGGGQASLTEPADTKPASVRDDIEAAFAEQDEKVDEKAEADEKKAVATKEADAKTDKVEAKDEPKKAAKDEAKPDAKAASDEKSAPQADTKADGAEEPHDGEDKQDGKPARYSEAPRNFLPDSREVWRNVPRAVRRDIETMVKEHETAIGHFRAANERYETVRDFDELARSNGRELRESLSRVVEFENLLASNPVAGLNRILMEAGPRKADGQPVSLYEVADFIVKQGPQGYQQIVAHRDQPQQQQSNPEVEGLKKQIADMQVQMATSSIIEPFAASHPRYYELQDDIALFLSSGKVPGSLSPAERLEVAYGMAERINPLSRVANDHASDGADELHERRAAKDFSGSKSIKSSPGSVTEEVEDMAKGNESSRDSILTEMRRLKRA